MNGECESSFVDRGEAKSTTCIHDDSSSFPFFFAAMGGIGLTVLQRSEQSNTIRFLSRTRAEPFKPSVDFGCKVDAAWG